MDEPQTAYIKPVLPRREWLLRCNDNNTNLAVCSICVNDGDIEIVSPEVDIITLEPAQIAEFHRALHAAIELAETDLAKRETTRADARAGLVR